MQLSTISLGLSRIYGSPFIPSSLFAAGEQGAWYDPSDLSTLFQDSAGTTPVTAVEQPVGLILDKSKGLVLGSELVTNGDFSNGATGWTLGPEWSVSGGAASKASGTSTTGIIQPVATANWIKVEFDIISISGSVSPQYVQQNLSNGATGPIFNSTGRKSCYIQKNANATGQMAVVFSTYNNTQTVTIDNISVRELPGNHAFQSTAASRPVLRQEASGAYYLAFDGVDDGMVTNSINFSATDKMTVVAGVRKLSDVGFQAFAELSATSSTNNGSFGVMVADGSAANYQWRSRGTSLASTNTSNNFAAPLTSVLTGTSDISGDSAILRVDGTQAASNTADQGTGNYGNYPLFIGRRGGTTLPFNGRLYGLIVRGAASTAQQITQAESWMNSKTRAF